MYFINKLLVMCVRSGDIATLFAELVTIRLLLNVLNQATVAVHWVHKISPILDS